MNTQAMNAQINGKATTTKTTFSRETTVSITIAASKEKIWEVLTDAASYPNWNSTVVSLEGEIKPNKRIKLKSTLDPKRTFKLKVKTCEEPHMLTWGDSKGNRVFTLKDKESGVELTMREKIGGLMFPMYAKYIPPFDESFEQFVQDLKREVERQ